jgi:uncharacterized protein YcbX
MFGRDPSGTIEPVSDSRNGRFEAASPARVIELWRFPVKSMGGERVQSLEIDRDGVVGDRRFAVRDLETGLIASAKRPGRWGSLLACRATTSTAGSVRVTLPDGSSHDAEDATVNDALSRLTGRQVALEHVEAPNPAASRDYEAEFPELDHVELRGRRSFPTTMMTDARSFVDLAALHLITTSTIAAISAASGSDQVTSLRFRPNLVVDSGPHTGFVEDDWAGSALRVGPELALDRVIRAARCVMTSVEQPDLPADKRILQSIARENRVETAEVGPMPCAGLFAEVHTSGTVSEGDPLVCVDPR